MKLNKFAFIVGSATFAALVYVTPVPAVSRASSSNAQTSLTAIINGRNPQAITALYAADATLVLPAATAITGKAAINHAWSELLGVAIYPADRSNAPAQPMQTRSTFALSNLRATRDAKLRLEAATYSMSVSRGGDTFTTNGRVSTLWQLQPTGAWLITMQTFTQDPSGEIR